MSLSKRSAAEFIGTFWLVLGGCGSAVLAAAFPEVGIGLLGVSFAFGLTVLTMAFAIGHISGCHLNPAVSVGLWIGGRFDAKELIPYIIAQVLGGIAGAGVLYVVATGNGADLGNSPGAPIFICEVEDNNRSLPALIRHCGALFVNFPNLNGVWLRPCSSI